MLLRTARLDLYRAGVVRVRKVPDCSDLLYISLLLRSEGTWVRVRCVGLRAGLSEKDRELVCGSELLDYFGVVEGLAFLEARLVLGGGRDVEEACDIGEDGGIDVAYTPVRIAVRLAGDVQDAG